MLRLPQDLRGSDLVLALLAPLCLLGLAARSCASAEPVADGPATLLGERAVRVTPVFTSAAGGLGELPGLSSLAHAPSAGAPAASPGEARPRRRRGAGKRSSKPAADGAIEPSTPASEGGSPSPDAAVQGAPAEGGEAGSAPGGGAEGEGEDPSAGGGGEAGDRLASQAIAAYRARLIAWFSRRFVVRGSGLRPEVLRAAKVRAEVDIGDSGLVLGYRILAADHPALDRGARDALEAVRGETLPPPPDFYPQALPPRLRITFICTESTCD